jgi:hypothetical protein
VWVTGIYLYALGGLTVASETAGVLFEDQKKIFFLFGRA